MITQDDLDRILAAAAFAADMQRRKDAEASPYINHPLALAHVLSREGARKDGPNIIVGRATS
ncbi:MAG: hypothetical protein ACXWUQ_10105 [Allosphingosinicella sp.]